MVEVVVVEVKVKEMEVKIELRMRLNSLERHDIREASILLQQDDAMSTIDVEPLHLC